MWYVPPKWFLGTAWIKPNMIPGNEQYKINYIFKKKKKMKKCRVDNLQCSHFPNQYFLSYFVLFLFLCWFPYKIVPKSCAAIAFIFLRKQGLGIRHAFPGLLRVKGRVMCKPHL